MIAFKTYAKAPTEQVPSGMPIDIPWMMQYCTEQEAQGLKENGWTVVSEETYETYAASLADALTEYESVKTQLAVEKSINDAMNFGTQCLREFSAENVLLGITLSGMTGTILNLLQGVMQALLAGSLYEAITRIKAIDPANFDGTFLNEVRVIKFLNKIETYLGITLTETL